MRLYHDDNDDNDNNHDDNHDDNREDNRDDNGDREEAEADSVGVALDETTDHDDLLNILAAFGGNDAATIDLDDLTV